MKFFLSNSEDLVDPHYDFVNDAHAPDRDRWRDDVFPYQLLAEPICDGVFLSGVANRALGRQIETAGSVQRHLHAPPDFPVMGDCNAFQYVEREAPPYKTEDVVTLYQCHGYGFGASVDHLIVAGLNETEKERRWNITIENARKFIDAHHTGHCTFVPIGIAQGWDVISYRRAVERLLEFGYQYIAVGGITRLQTRQLTPILEEILSVMPANVRLHLLGVARAADLSLLQRLGVSSFNGSTPIKRATMGEYWTLDDRKYEAIRIPPVSKRQQSLSPSRLRQSEEVIAADAVSELDMVSLEQRCLSLLWAYNQDKASCEDVLEAVLRYNRLTGDVEDRRDSYERTLRERPWRACRCDICRAIGIQVIIFRGNDRNRRRGFHNAWVFYQRLRAAASESN